MAAESTEAARERRLVGPRRRAWAGAVLAAYLLVVLYLTLVWHPSGARPPRGPRLNLRPCATTVAFLHKGGREMLVNVVGNLALLAPLGLLAPCVGPRIVRGRVGRVVLLCGAFSLAIESLQYLSGWRIADIDDILLNTLGGLLGYLAGRGIHALARSRPGL